MAFGFGGLLGGGAIPDVQMPDGLPIAGGQGSPLVDAFLALQGQRIKDAVTAPRDAYTGDLQVMGPDGHPTAEAMDRATGLAGLAMTGGFAGVAASPAETVLGMGAPRRLTFNSPLFGSSRITEKAAQELLENRKSTIAATTADPSLGTVPQSMHTEVERLEALLPRFSEPAGGPRGRPFMPLRPVEGDGPFAVKVHEHPDFPDSRQYRIYDQLPDGRLSRPRGTADVSLEPDGRWRTDMLETREGQQGRGLATALYDALERDTGQKRLPSGQLLPDGYRFWSKRDPEAVQYHQPFGDEYWSPKRIKDKLDDPNAYASVPDKRAELQAAFDRVPPEGKTPEALALQHYAIPGAAGLGAGASAFAQPGDAQASEPPQNPSIATGASPVSAGLQIPSLGDLSPEMQAQIMQMLGQGPQAQPAVPSPVDSLLFDRAGMGGGANGFSGTSGTVMPPQVAQAPDQRPAPQVAAMPSPQATGAIARPAPIADSEDAPAAPARPTQAPQAPTPQVAAPQVSAPAAGMQPVNSFDPLTGQSVSGSPKPMGQAAAATGAKPSGGFDLGSALGRMNQSGLSDQLIAIGAGIMSGRTFGEGLGEGLSNAQRVASQAMAGRLAQAKVDREQAAAAGNAAIYKKYFPNATPEEALAGGSNSSIMTELMKRGLPATETYRQETDDNGIWQVNTANGQRSLLKAAEKDQTVKPVTEEERASLGLPPGVYQRDANGKVSTVAQAGENKTVTQIPEAERAQMGLPAGAYQRDANGKISPINPSGTTINMGAEKAQDATVGKSFGDYQVDLATKGRNAANTLNSLALMEQAMKTPGFYSGVGGEGVKRANQFLAALGVKDPRAASATEVFDALSNKVVLDGLGGSLGPGISNTDRDYIARTAPTLAQSQQGNSDLIGVARTLAQRQQAVAKLAREYAAGNNGRLDSGFDAKLEEYASQNPLFPQAAAGASASPPREAPQGAPAGARQAPDGQWYVSDPNRPGKYLKVQ